MTRAVGQFVAATAVAVAVSAGAAAERHDDAYLTWPAKQATDTGMSWRANGRVGGAFDLRVINTNRSYNYKLRATWMTPEAIRASARFHQLRLRLSDEQTRELVQEAESVEGTVMMIEIDPREGSGVIPLDWLAFLRPKGSTNREVAGIQARRLRDVKALSGVATRDYAYDQFWVIFPLKTNDGLPLFGSSDMEAELAVTIHHKGGRVSWTVPDSIRQRE